MSVKSSAEQALAAGLRDVLDVDLRAAKLSDVLVSTIGAAELEAACGDIAVGDGDELGWKELKDGRRQRPKLPPPIARAVWR